MHTETQAHKRRASKPRAPVNEGVTGPRTKKYLQLKYTVSMPEKISICLNRGREESGGNDDVSIVRNS